MLTPPLAVIATWPIPNYENPETHGPACFDINIIFQVLALVVVGMRFYTRLRITGSFGIDDVLVGLALIPTIGLTVITLVTYDQSKWNRHIWDVIPSTITTIAKLELAGAILYGTASTIIKLSLSAFCLRLIANTGRRGYRWCIIGAIFAQVSLWISFMATILSQCRPLSAYWELDPTYPYTCISQGVFLLVFGIINVILDFLYFILPVPLIWTLQLPLRQRIAVSSLFLLGTVSCICSIIRVYYSDLAMRRSDDITWWLYPQTLAAALEIDLGLICASAPALRPFLARYWPRGIQSTRQNRGIRFVYPRKEVKELELQDCDVTSTDRITQPQISHFSDSYKGTAAWREEIHEISEIEDREVGEE
ncbi:MAG: hypothetical protein M1827_002160 [Pycnora praestabilis]|nr:MAG: hypothetical protein M1827_002160 [Pycnora praestabilis]